MHTYMDAFRIFRRGVKVADKLKKNRDVLMGYLLEDERLIRKFIFKKFNDPIGILFREDGVDKQVITVDERVIKVKKDFFDTTCDYQIENTGFDDLGFASEKASIINDLADLLLNVREEN